MSALTPATEPTGSTVLLYSDNPDVRAAMRGAIGAAPAPDVTGVTFVEAGSGLTFRQAVDGGGIDLVVIDGEARPEGGFGLAKQIKDELDDCPPTLILMARQGDAWLASWALADGTLPLPVDAPKTRAAAADLLRQRAAAVPVRRAAAI
jgi:DNA-binding response OmpR family regulator